jgi:hypothetical protein
MKIQPVSTWQNGQEVFATQFTMVSSYDNLIDQANFSYCLSQVLEDGTLYPLVNSQLPISGQNYIDWDNAPNINQWAYEWAAGQLNLVLIPE